jgi:hypothetical protein
VGQLGGSRGSPGPPMVLEVLVGHASPMSRHSPWFLTESFDR